MSASAFPKVPKSQEWQFYYGKAADNSETKIVIDRLGESWKESARRQHAADHFLALLDSLLFGQIWLAPSFLISGNSALLSHVPSPTKRQFRPFGFIILDIFVYIASRYKMPGVPRSKGCQTCKRRKIKVSEAE